MKEIRTKSRYYYKNILANQNQTSKNNLVWAADITCIKLATV